MLYKQCAKAELKVRPKQSRYRILECYSTEGRLLLRLLSWKYGRDLHSRSGQRLEREKPSGSAIDPLLICGDLENNRNPQMTTGPHKIQAQCHFPKLLANDRPPLGTWIAMCGAMNFHFHISAVLGVVTSVGITRFGATCGNCRPFSDTSLHTNSSDIE
ncbi:hypothetical protein H4582DRAFT_458502 [Lactarius indigo]|nr:hypothetical protein H4582DRAFT_458502 [Lactarius indigo]